MHGFQGKHHIRRRRQPLIICALWCALLLAYAMSLNVVIDACSELRWWHHPAAAGRRTRAVRGGMEQLSAAAHARATRGGRGRWGRAGVAEAFASCFVDGWVCFHTHGYLF